jgi:ArsR family metal-binding transcriptional regulator
MNTSKIEAILPDCKLGEIRPCTKPGLLQFHLLVKDLKDLTSKVIDIPKLTKILSNDGRFIEVKSSEELGVVKAKYGEAEITILMSGRIVVKKTSSEGEAQEILENLAPLVRDSIF